MAAAEDPVFPDGLNECRLMRVPRETRRAASRVDGFFIALDALGDLADRQSVGEPLGGLFELEPEKF